MSGLHKTAAVMIACVVLTAADRADPTRQVILIPSSDVTAHTDPDTTLGPYYTMSYTPPDGLTAVNLERAILEVFVDVSAKGRDRYVNEAPVLELYALKEPFLGTLDPTSLDRATRSVRPVAAGVGRRVALDITAIIRSHLEGTIDNHGLILGSVTGMREGEFTLVPGNLPQGAAAQIRIYRKRELVPAGVRSEEKRRW